MDIEKNVTGWLEKNSSQLTRRAKRFLAMYFPNSSLRRRFWIETGVILGENSYMNLNVTVVDDYLNDEVLLEIGKNCSIAPGVVFAPVSSHNNSVILRQMGVLGRFENRGKIIIGDDVWIGANCTVMAGIRIGNCSIIGANSFVNTDIPDYSLAYGTPVRIIQDLRSTDVKK